jgi:hypothetical protein
MKTKDFESRKSNGRMQWHGIGLADDDSGEGREGLCQYSRAYSANLETFPTLPRPSRDQVIPGQIRHRRGRVGKVGKVYSFASMCASRERGPSLPSPCSLRPPGASRLSTAQERTRGQGRPARAARLMGARAGRPGRPGLGRPARPGRAGGLEARAAAGRVRHRGAPSGRARPARCHRRPPTPGRPRAWPGLARPTWATRHPKVLYHRRLDRPPGPC